MRRYATYLMSRQSLFAFFLTFALKLLHIYSFSVVSGSWVPFSGQYGLLEFLAMIGFAGNMFNAFVIGSPLGDYILAVAIVLITIMVWRDSKEDTVHNFYVETFIFFVGYYTIATYWTTHYLVPHIAP